MPNSTMEIKWIYLKEASELAGLPPKTFKRYVSEGKLSVAYTKITRKSEPRYNEYDIIRMLNERAINQ